MTHPMRRKPKLDEIIKPGAQNVDTLDANGRFSFSESTMPLFQKVKNYIIQKIETGEWKPSMCIPSENEIVGFLGVSRSTVSRAFRELTMEGYLVRIQGVGTFVASQRPSSALLEIRSISEEIIERGGQHSCEVLLLAKETANMDLARAFHLPEWSPIYHSIIVHRDSGTPVQIEERFVNPAFAPDYLKQDFTSITPSEHLFQMGKLTEAEHIIETVMPDEKTQRLLEIPAGEPCLVLHRRTWSAPLVASKAALIYPGSRTKLGGRFSPGANSPF